MELEVVSLPEKNKIMQAYLNDNDFLHTFFEYKNDESSYPSRLKDLGERTYKRQELATVIHSFMKPFGLSRQAEQHIKELAKDGVVVVGGQQAGLLTGPLYSVHKAITVILLAKRQRTSLGIPVVPVFWVAGEDHDLNEINHVNTELNGSPTKNQYREKFILKLMASDATYDKKMMASFIKETFGKFGETAYTKELLEEVLQSAEHESTFTDFFVRLMNGLFKDEGLLFLDSAYKPLRELEKAYFGQLVNESEKIAEAIHSKEQQFKKEGYGEPIGAEPDAANLFYVHETGRVLLTRQEELFVNVSTGTSFSKLELLKIAEEQPWLLSNNVATRPLMQDMVFPVLAFVGGPGEIAYWALLKEAFGYLHMKMPIIVPRMSMTLVTPHVKHLMDEKEFGIADVIAGKVTIAREAFIESLTNERFDSSIRQTKELLSDQYEQLAAHIDEENPGLADLIKKNLQFHVTQLDYLKGKSDEALLLKHEVMVRAYSLLEGELLPDGGLQERVYTPYSYLNSYGPTLINNLLSLPLELDGTHKIIYL